MLDLIRSNSQSTGVKIAFGIIILVFVFWGIGSFTDTGSVNVVAMVNDQPLTFQQFELAYRNAEESVSRNNPGGRLGETQKRDLGRSVFQSLVGDMLICQEAERNHMSVSPLELRLYVDSIKAFQNEKGKFDPEVYKRVLNQQRQTPAQFEESISKQILKEKYLNFATGGIWVDMMEPRARFNFIRQRRAVEYVFVSAKEGSASVSPDDAACKSFYEAHKGDYAVPQKVKVEYILVDPATLVKPESISAEEAKKWYDSHLSTYSQPKSVEASHILVEVPKDASEEVMKKAEVKIAAIKTELDKGASFAATADKYNSPKAAGKGGKLGWITPGMTVPAFEAAAFSARPGFVSGPVRTEFGLHLILVEKVKDEGVKPFADVEKELKETLASYKGKEQISEVLDSLAEENILGKPMEKSAAKFGLKAETSPLSSQAELQTLLSLKPENASTVMSTSAGHPVDTPLEAGERYVIVRVDESIPASFKDLKEVKEEIVSRIKTEKGVALACETLQKAIKDGKGSLPENFAKKVQTTELERNGALGEFQTNKELGEVLFSSKPGTWISRVFPVSSAKESGAVACRVVKLIDPKDEDWHQAEGFMTELMHRERGEGVYMALMQDLFSKGQVKVMNPKAIDRENM